MPEQKAFSIESEAEFHAFAERQLQRGKLKIDTVSPEGQSVMLEDLVDPSLTAGLYLEIGFGFAPYAATTTRAFTKDARYVGIDGGTSEYYYNSGPSWLERGSLQRPIFWETAVNALRSSPNAPYAQLIAGDGQRLPFPDASKNDLLPVREVYMADTILAPGMHHRSAQRIFNESARVLDPRGFLVIKEDILEVYRLEAKLIELSQMLKEAGFGRRTLITYAPEIPKEDFVSLRYQFAPPGYNATRQQKIQNIHPTDAYLVCQLGEGEKETSRRSFGAKLRELLGQSHS